MLPHESLRRSAAAGNSNPSAVDPQRAVSPNRTDKRTASPASVPRGRLNSPTAHHAAHPTDSADPNSADDCLSSLVRPHSRQVASSSMKQSHHHASTVRATSPNTKQVRNAGGSSSQPLHSDALHQSSPAHTVRTIGRAIVNPKTLFATSAVTTSSAVIPRHPATDSQHQQQHSPLRLRVDSPDRQQGFHFTQPNQSSSSHPAPPHSYSTALHPTSPTSRPGTTTLTSTLQLTDISLLTSPLKQGRDPTLGYSLVAAMPPHFSSSNVGGPRPTSMASGLSSYHEVGVFGMTALRQHYGTTENDVLVRGGGRGSSLAVAAGAEMTAEVVATTGPSSSSTDGLAPLAHDVDRVRVANKRGPAALGGCDSTPWENELQGVDVRRLVPPSLPAVDLKKVDMLEKLAPATAFDIIPPSITLQGEPNVVFDLSDAQLLHQSSSLPTTHGADEEDSHALAVRVPEFVVQTVTVRDAGIDRVLVYEVTVEVPGLFSSRFPPTIDSVTGDLIVFLDTKTSGTSRCHVCAVDVAMVDLTTGEPTKSNVLSFSITTLRSKGGGQSANSNTTTKKIGAAHSTTTKTKHIYASPTDFSATLPADQLLRLAQRATATEAANASAVDPQTGVPIVPYEFPPTNPHELRYWDVIHANQTWLYQQQQQSSASSSSSSSKQQQQHFHEKSNNGSSSGSTNGASKVETYQPVYDSSLSTLELLRFGRSTQERDRLAGEAVSLDDRETLVKRLRDRIAKEEADLNEHSGRAGSSSSSGGELELCPLLLRLSQVYMSYGVKKQGDTTELLERICRIRLRSIGLESFESLQQLSRSRSGGSSQHHHHQQRGGSESSAAGNPLFRDDDLRPSSSSAAARTAAMASLVSQASSNGGSGAITPVLGAVTPTSQNNSAAIVAVTVAAAAFDEKKMEALQQSLMVLVVYLRSVGRFHDAIEYSGCCLDAALVSSGDSSAAYLRALSELAELWLQVGEYARARTLFEECVAKSEVLFGVEAHSTNNLVHALGIAWGEESEYGKAIKCHDRVLKIRQKAFGEGREAPNNNSNNNNNNATNAADQLLLAESMTLAAFYRSLSGSSSPATRERVTDLVESALTILTKSTASSEKVAPPSHFIASRSGLMVLLGRLIVSAGDIPRAITYMGRAYADLTTARGHDSLEAALVRVSLLAAKLMQYPRCLIDDTTNAIVGELVQATAVLTAQLGPQHPATLHTSSLLAESRLFRNPTESSSQLEKNLSSMQNIFVSTHRSLLAAHRVTAESQLVLRRGSAALSNALAAHKIGSLLHMADQSMIALDTLLLGAMTRTRTLPSDELVEILERRLAFMVDLHGETNPLHVPCLQNLAEACFLRSDFTRSHYYLSRALKIADSVNFIFLLGGLFKPAAQLSMQEWQERNRMARDRIHTGQALQFAELLFTVGTVFAAEGKSDDAQSTFLQSFAALELSAVANSLGMVLVQHALSTLLYAGGHVGDALAYAERAYSLLLEHFSTRESLMEMLTDTTRAISFQLRCSGYQLLRHTDSRHRFASYL